jgi:hypothetical protein
MDGDCADPGLAITNLKKGPVNILEVQEAGEEFTDTDFEVPDALFWEGYEDSTLESNYDTRLNNGQYTWERWHDNLPNSVLMEDDTVTYLEPNQGGMGTCYIVASYSAAAEFPSLITDAFITGTEDSPIGLYGL